MTIPASRCGTWFTSREDTDRKGDQVDLDKLTMGEKIVAGAGIVLIIDLLFLPWHNIDIGILSVSRKAIQSPNALWGVLALLLAVAMVAVVCVSRFTTTQLPDLPVPWPQAMFIGGIAVAALLVLKLILETSFLGFGAILGVLLGAGMAYGGFLMRNEAGPAVAPPGSSHGPVI